jgi:hypothetical protein
LDVHTQGKAFHGTVHFFRQGISNTVAGAVDPFSGKERLSGLVGNKETYRISVSKKSRMHEPITNRIGCELDPTKGRPRSIGQSSSQP